MFWRKVDPKEQARVLGLLASYEEAKDEINGAQHAISTEYFPDIQSKSDEFGEAVKASLTTVGKVEAEIRDPSFWPDLNDNKGSRILLEFRSGFVEHCRHTLTFLRLIRAEAKGGKNAYRQDIEGTIRAMNHAVAQHSGALRKLLRHYKFDKWTPEDFRSIKHLIKDFKSRTDDVMKDIEFRGDDLLKDIHRVKEARREDG